MAITRFAHRWLQDFVAEAHASGRLPRGTARNAVVLTGVQHAKLAALLKAQWGSHYACPLAVDIKPQHGYRSRVERDGFLPDDYVEWLVLGCSDVAEVASQEDGRPYLVVRNVRDRWAQTFDLVVPVTSDVFGSVHIPGVIPKGLPGRRSSKARTKKQPPRLSPRPLESEC